MNKKEWKKLLIDVEDCLSYGWSASQIRERLCISKENMEFINRRYNLVDRNESFLVELERCKRQPKSHKARMMRYEIKKVSDRLWMNKSVFARYFEGEKGYMAGIIMKGLLEQYREENEINWSDTAIKDVTGEGGRAYFFGEYGWITKKIGGIR